MIRFRVINRVGLGLLFGVHLGLRLGFWLGPDTRLDPISTRLDPIKLWLELLDTLGIMGEKTAVITD